MDGGASSHIKQGENDGEALGREEPRLSVTWSNERERRFRRETLRLLRWDATRHDATLSSSSSLGKSRGLTGARAIFNTWNFFSTFATRLTTFPFFLFRPSLPPPLLLFSFFLSFRFGSFLFFSRERRVINTSRNTIREVRLEYETCFTKQNRRVDHERI